MAQPAVLPVYGRLAARRADGNAFHILGDSFALNGEQDTAYEESWRPAKTLIYVFAACSAFWIAAALAYITFH
jgi:hypothetical protein